MGDGGHVSDAGYVETGGLEGAYSGLSTCSWAFDEYVYPLEALVEGLLCGLLRRSLGGEGCALPGPFESAGAGGGPADGVALNVGKGHLGVVERGADVGATIGSHSLLSPAASLSWHLG